MDLNPFEIIPEPPFCEYYRADVFILPRDNRRMIRMYKSGGGRYTTTYARYLFQIDFWNKYNEMIPDEMEVDHIDEDKLNDDVSNLQLLTHSENVTKNNFSKGTMYNFCTCPICGTNFTKAQHMTIPFAINVCSSICLRSLQMSHIGEALRKHLSKLQFLLTFRVYRNFPSGEEYFCEIVNQFNDCFYPNTLATAEKWLPKELLKEFRFVDYSKRSKEIVEMRKNGVSYRKIGRMLGLDKNSIRRTMVSLLPI